ncbi:MAG TPA: ParB/RepB/Spo0J family partition protein [Candidatus Dormibacteraeota bacterium]|nr:ParB/RepB/Spo0J family partition protein [Candidatus Dormibacteraeota bacterium]
MSAQKRGLGRGLNALLGDAGIAPTPTRPVAQSEMSDASAEIVRDLAVDRIAPNPAQPRKHFDEGSLAELATSIAQYGVLVPIIVRARGERFEIVAGERRWRASALAKRATIPAILRKSDDGDAIEVAIVENLQRENLNPLEEAAGFAHLIEEYNFTQEQLAKRLGKSRPAIANALRLLALDDDIKKLLVEGAISAGHARALLAISPDVRGPLATRIVAEGLSVRSIEDLVRETAAPAPREHRADKREAQLSADERDFVQRLRERFGTAIVLVRSGVGGRIEVRFADENELLRIGDLLLHT